MIIIGTLDTRDDADLLPDVLDKMPHMDAIYAYDDGSMDETETILRSHPKITKYVNRRDFTPVELASVPQHRRHHLLQMVKDDFDCHKEIVWVVRLEGDRYFMNTTPWEMVNRATNKGLEGVAGVMVDCRIGPNEQWEHLDSWPNWHMPITQIQTWGRIDDVHPVVAFRLYDEVLYSTKKPRPWPIIWGPTDYQENDYVTADMAFFAHHGRRGPKYWSWAYTSGSRPKSSKFPQDWNFINPFEANETIWGLPFRPRKGNPIEQTHWLQSAYTTYQNPQGNRPYMGELLQNDIANLCAIWNDLAPRRK